MDDPFSFNQLKYVFFPENLAPTNNDPLLPNPAEALDFTVADHGVKLDLIQLRVLRDKINNRTI